MFNDWTKEELNKVTTELQQIPIEQRKAVKDSIKDLDSVQQALSVIASVKAVISQNKPVLANQGTTDHQTTENPVLERVNGETVSNNLDIEQLTDTINRYILDYCIKNGMDTDTDLIKAPQRIWGAVSHYIGKHVFSEPRILFEPHKPNTIDIYKVVQVIPIYYTLCDKYNKAVLIDYVAYFLGVSDQWMYDHTTKLTTLGVDLAKKREDSLTACIVDGKQSPVGALAVLNHFHGWNTASTRTERTTEKVIAYPVLVDINKDKVVPAIGQNNSNTP